MHFPKIAKIDFKCPNCNKSYADENELYLNRCNKNKDFCTTIKCSCGKPFRMTYNTFGNAVSFPVIPIKADRVISTNAENIMKKQISKNQEIAVLLKRIENLQITERLNGEKIEELKKSAAEDNEFLKETATAMEKLEKSIQNSQNIISDINQLSALCLTNRYLRPAVIFMLIEVINSRTRQ